MAAATDPSPEPAVRAHIWLRNLIVEGVIGPAEPIRQDKLAHELGISKIPLREALARLQQSGLVQRVHNKGFIAAPLSKEEADDVFATRLLLEPPTVRVAVERATGDDIEALEDAVGRLQGAKPAVGESASARLAVVLRLLRPAGRPTVERFVTTLFCRSERYLSRRATEFAGDDELPELVRAFRARRPAAAREIYEARLRARWRSACDGLVSPA